MPAIVKWAIATTAGNQRDPNSPNPTTIASISPATTIHPIVVKSIFLAANIDLDWRVRLHEYLGGTVNGLDGYSQGVGGTADHVHLLVSLKSTHCLADFMRELKKAASVWVHDEIGVREFAWQEGYGAFTVSPNARQGVKQYIANQEEHHRRKTFRE